MQSTAIATMLADAMRTDADYNVLNGDQFGPKATAVIRELADITLHPMCRSTQWISVDEQLPPDETPVLVILRGELAIGELRWENPSHEETYEPFRYWDNPHNDGQDWQWHDVTHWMPSPALPHLA
jgi:hypothetical protein